MSRVAIITGATSGFGAACARRFHASGWRLVLVARRADRLKAIAAELGGAATLTLDVRDGDAVAKALAPIEADLLVNNAGLALGTNPAQTAELEDWETMVDTNIKGLMYCTRAVLPGMTARNRGHIVNMGSVAASWPYPGGNAYGATKAFVQQFSRNLRCDVLGTRVRVSLVEPGMAETEFSLVRFKGDAAKAAKVYAGADALSADDIADIVHWIAALPERVNVNSLEVMPTCQAWGAFAVHRRQ